MPSYRERLAARELLKPFEQARTARDDAAMARVLTAAQFTPMEIESILWAKGRNVEPAPTAEDKRRGFREAIVGRLATAILSGLILGGVFVYVSSGLADRRPGASETRILMSDQRSPREAYYKPFLWGFALGSAGALLTGTLIFDPTSKMN